MASEQQNEAKIVNEARKIPSGDHRQVYLDEACGTDASLRKRVDKLLAADTEESPFLGPSAAGRENTPVTDKAGENLAASLDAGQSAAFAKDEAVVVGSTGHSVLKMLGQTIDVPHVSLREANGESAEPIERPNSPEIPVQKTSGRYRLDGEIARGGMGAIIKGRDTDLGRDLAIKVLLGEHKRKPEVIRRFVEEAQIGGQLQHPGIVPVYELGQFADQRPFFSMKLVKGQTLSKLLTERGDAADDRGKFLGIFDHVCQTMAYAHSRGVIHRDLKPANVMVGAFGEVQVMDWGLAKVLPVGGVADEKKSRDKTQGQSIVQTLRSVGSDTPGSFGSTGSQTQMGSVMGTPAYMPPEQALGEIDNLDERADVFGLGAILCEILTGAAPYIGDDGTQIFRLASRGKLTACFERLDACGADADLIALTKHCLELEPVDRPRDAGELAERVTGYLEAVEMKLRDTEMQRAAQEARADAESSQAKAERQRAEAEAAQAEAERQRRVQQQRAARQLRIMIGGLALVATVAVGTSIVAVKNANSARKSEANATAALAQAESARSAAQAAYVNEGAARRTAEVATEQARQQVVRLHVGNGNDFLSGPDHGPALLWFGHAWYSDAAVGAHDMNHRLRVGQMLSSDPELIGLAVHDSQVNDVAIDDTSSLVITLTKNAEAYLCELPTGQKTLLPHPDRVTAIAFRPAGDWAVTGSVDGMAYVWDTATGKLLHKLNHGSSISSVALAAEGTFVATVGGKSGVKLWDVKTGEPDGAAPTVPGAYFATFDLAGDKLLTADATGFARVWNTATGEPLCPPRPHERVHNGDGPVFTPDGKGVITHVPTNLTERSQNSGLPNGDCKFWTWPAVGGNDPLWGPVPVRDIADYSFSPDGKYLLSAAKVHRLFDLASGKMLAIARNPRETQVVCFTSNTTYLAGSSGGWLQEWVISTDSAKNNVTVTPSSVWGHAAGTFTRLFAVPERGAVTTGRDGIVRLYQDPAFAPPRPYAFNCGRAHLLRPAFSNDSSQTNVVFSPDGLIECRYARDFPPRISSRGAVNLPITLNTSPVQWSKFCGNGEVLVTFDGKYLQCWQTATGIAIGPPVTKPYDKILTAISDDGTVLAVGPNYLRGAQYDSSSDVVVYDVATGEPLQKFPCSQGGAMRMLFSPDGRLLEIAHSERIVEVWDVLGGTRLHRRKHQGVINDFNFSDDSQKLIVGTSDTTARIFDARTGVALGPPLRAGSFVRDVALAPDGRRAATRNRYGKIQLWDATTGEETGRWQLDEGDLASVNSMWFSRDGRRLIVDVNGGKAFELSPCTIPPDVLPPLLELFTGRRIDPATDGIEFLPVGTFKQSPDAYTNAWRTWRDAVASAQRLK